MQRRTNLVYLVLAGVVLGLTPLIVVVDAQARIAFSSDRDGHGNSEIYVMDNDGGNPRNLSNHPNDDEGPAWYNLFFQLFLQGRPSRYGVGSNRLTDNCYY